MKIIARVNHVKDVVKANHASGGTLGADIQRLSFGAIQHGIASRAWAKYMSIFADNTAQLKRLTGEDDLANVGYVKESCAYLVASGPCGGMTPTFFSEFMSPDIDQGLPEEPDGTIIRPINIP